jgi:hypothetical protein
VKEARGTQIPRAFCADTAGATGSEKSPSVFSGTGTLLDDGTLAHEAQNTAPRLPTSFVVRDVYRGEENSLSAPIAIRVMIVDDHQGWGPSAMEKTGHLANGKSPTWLMTPAAACCILESKEGLGTSNTGSRGARFF